MVTYDDHMLTRDVQSTNLVVLILNSRDDCYSSLSTTIAACKLQHVFRGWGQGVENLNWVVTCLDLSKKMMFQ